MKSLNDIRRQINPALQKIELLRKEKLQAISKAKKWYILPVIILVFSVLSFLSGSLPLTIFCAVISFISFVLVYLLKISPHKREFVHSFKHQVFSSFVSSLYPNSYYAPDNYLPSNIFSSSQLFGSYDSYSGEDYFEGETESGCAFKFSELRVTDTTTDSDGDSTTTTVFDGVFFILDVPQRVSGRVQVIPDSAESSFGMLGKFMQKTMGSLFQGGKMVYFEEHPEFEKEFVVYSKDEEEARRLLSPALIKAIYDLKIKWNKRLRLSFINNQIYIALSTGNNFFQPDIHKSLLNDNILHELYDELSLCFSVVEDLSIEHDDKYNHLNTDTIKPETKIYKKSDNSNNPFLL
jgi:hypothetical protein